MSNLSVDICKVSYKNQSKLKRLVEPFFRSTGIEGFWYWTITEDGNFTHITTQPNMSEFFYCEELFKGHPHFRTPKHIPSSFLLPDKMSDIEYEKTQGVMNDKFTLDQLFLVVNSDSKNLSGYGFGTYVGRPDLTNFYLNNLFLFRKFINYFHEECSDMVRKAEDKAVNIATAVGDSFYKPTTLFADISLKNENKLFLSTKHQLQLEALSMLSKREKECIKWLLRGRSASQIGKIIHLSPRTVEFYLVNIKNKLFCDTKQELFDCLLNWKEYIQAIFF